MTHERHEELVGVCAYGGTLAERSAADLELTIDMVQRLEASDMLAPGFDAFSEVRGGLRRAQFHATWGRLCSPFAFGGRLISLAHSPRRPLAYPWIPVPEEI